MSIFVVFGAGFLASLSPCVYPLIPITLGFFGSQTGDKRTLNILSYTAGQILAFVMLGVVAVFIGETLGFTSESKIVNYFTGGILIFAGSISLYGKLPHFLTNFRFFSGQAERSMLTSWGAGGALVLGAASALIASPCTSPLLAGVLTLMASSATLLKGLLYMLIYSLGFASLFLILGLGLVNIKKLPRSGQWMVYLHKGSSLVMIVAGFYYLLKSFIIG